MIRDNQKVLVVIPAYNEHGRVGDIIRAAKLILPSAKVLVVNDCSSDDTGNESVGAGADVVTHLINLGYGAALETGYFYALKYGYEFIVQMDGDGQHLPDEVPQILAPVLDGRADIVIGSRYLSSVSTYKTSFVRKAGQKIFGMILSLIIGYKITDPTSGFQCLNRKAFELFSRGQFPNDFPDADVLLMAHYAGFRVKEVPVVMLGRSGGESMHAGLKPLYYVIKMILSIVMVFLSQRRWKQYVP
ncbi:MAG: glycosyltransferase family 2 protein [Deltaproteobacteria bacterium]|nr:glycosyltransferase family 2 protein [Deltaproteobacteria bacterium]